jgi:hypothetical protein
MKASQGHRAKTGRRRFAVGVVCCLAILVGGLVVPSSPASAFTTVVYSGAGPNVPRISVIGDSVGSGIRWTRSYAPLTRFNFTFDAESCRRTILPSCRGREGYAPLNVLQTMRRLEGLLGDVLVLMSGYNDAGSIFGAGVDAVMAEAARQGVPRVLWLTMRTADVSYVSPQYRSSASTFRDNNRILLQRAQQYGGALQIADWATYSANHPSWVGSDGVHLSVRGAPIAAAFIADEAGKVLDGMRSDVVAVDTSIGAAYAAHSAGRELVPHGTPWLSGWGAGDFEMFLADVSGNGRDDLIARARPSGQWYVALSNGNGFVPSDHLWLTNWGWGNSLQLMTGDVDGDRRADVVAIDTSTGRSYVARSSGDSFTPYGHVWLSGWGAGDFEMFLADVNGDGRSDLIARARPTGDWYVALSNGNGFVPSDHLWLTHWAWGDGFTLLAGDVTGDGRDDIVALDRGTGSSYVARSSGNGFTPYGHVWLTGWGAGNFRLLPGDVNADGRSDLIAKATNGSWYVALSNGNGFVPSDHLWLTNWAWGDGFQLMSGNVTG